MSLASFWQHLNEAMLWLMFPSWKLPTCTCTARPFPSPTVGDRIIMEVIDWGAREDETLNAVFPLLRPYF